MNELIRTYEKKMRRLEALDEVVTFENLFDSKPIVAKYSVSFFFERQILKMRCFLTAAGETHLSALRQIRRADLKEEVKSVGPLHQGTKDCKFTPGAHQSRFMAVEATAQGVQFRAHNSIASDCWQFTISTTGMLAAYSPSRDQGRSSAVSTWIEETWRKTSPS